MEEQTPISKYLAGLEKRQAMLTPSPAPDPSIIRKINFEDDTFFQGNDQSILNVSSPDTAGRSGVKRKRLSVLGEVLGEEENRNKLSELERLLQRTQGELIDARAMNTKLEYQIGQIKKSHGERLLTFEATQNDMRTRLREATNQVEDLKEKVAKSDKKEDELREKVHQQTETHCAKVSALEAKIRVLEEENVDLKGKFESGNLKQSEELRKLSASLEETEMGAEKWVMEVQLLRDQLELKDKQLQKYQNDLREAQSIIPKYNELNAKYGQVQSSQETAQTLEERARYFENLYVKQQGENLRLIQKVEKISDENRMLKSSMNKEMLLEEQICEFEDEVKVLRSTLEEKATLEVERNELASQLRNWRTMAFKLDPDCTCPARFETYIRRIQNQLLEARHDFATSQHTIADKDRCITKNISEIAQLQAEVKRLTSNYDNVSQELKKLSRRHILVTKDRDGLKELKESYEQEFEGVLSKPLQARIGQLESTLAEYEALVQESQANKKACDECDKRMALVSELRSELEKVKSEKSEVETQLANASTLGSDDGNTTGVKIVSFGTNPSALSLEARLKELIKENEELKEKLEELQNESKAGPSTAAEGNSKDLEDRNKTLERRLEILSEAYDFETQQLQLIVNKLFGFDFVLVREPSVQIRLSSIYAHGPSNDFIFQESPNGDMLLLESPILDSFRDDIDRYLLREGSIPSFLASVTITYVQNQNASNQPASQEEEGHPDDSSVSLADQNPREIQVEVQRQGHPAIEDPESAEEDDEEEDDERDRDLDDDEVEEEHAEPDEEEDALPEDEEMEEDDYEDEGHDDEDESDGDPECESPPPLRRHPPTSRRPPPGDDSDDSDVIMID